MHRDRFVLACVVLALPAVAQRPAPRVLWSTADEVARQRAAQATPQAWLPLFTTPTLAVGRYQLRRGDKDEQSPHERDEVYHVLAGTAKLQVGDAVRAVQAGDTVFVAARTPHHFLDIEADLDVIVFFSAARTTAGGMAAAPPPREQTAFPETSQRGNTRIFYWYGDSSAGQVAIDFGRPRWRPAFTKFLDEPSAQRWRLGENFWTTLDTNIPLELGGVEVPVGQYYCVLANPPQGGLQLVLLDPVDVRQRRLDAYEASETVGGLVVPLQRGTQEQAAAELELELTLAPGAKDEGTLTIRFGREVCTAALLMHRVAR
ncbi:MAG: cupin domain-containing protein [Planctomycetes bacterium]|nr:cupin domain-containing protein [Planctomycetota bacterium]